MCGRFFRPPPLARDVSEPSNSERAPAASPRGLPLAFLVDGDNATSSMIGEMMAEASRYGTVEIRRVYGDWASGRLSSWRGTVQDHALVPIQQFTSVAGKNNTDSALIIDAMDILHGGRVGGFCIVSSDSDYTRLATRLRESGMFVVGIGRSQTPAAFRNACNVFVATENLAPSRGSAEPAGHHRPAARRAAQPEGSSEGAPVRKPAAEAFELIDRAFDAVAGEDGYAQLGELGNALLKLDPAFDSRTYGKGKLGDLLEVPPARYELTRPPPRTSGAVLVRRRAATKG